MTLEAILLVLATVLVCGTGLWIGVSSLRMERRHMAEILATHVERIRVLEAHLSELTAAHLHLTPPVLPKGLAAVAPAALPQEIETFLAQFDDAEARDEYRARFQARLDVGHDLPDELIADALAGRL